MKDMRVLAGITAALHIARQPGQAAVRPPAGAPAD